MTKHVVVFLNMNIESAYFDAKTYRHNLYWIRLQLTRVSIFFCKTVHIKLIQIKVLFVTVRFVRFADCTIHTALLVHDTKSQNLVSKMSRPSLYLSCQRFPWFFKLIILYPIKFDIKGFLFSIDFGHQGQSGVLS